MMRPLRDAPKLKLINSENFRQMSRHTLRFLRLDSSPSYDNPGADTLIGWADQLLNTDLSPLDDQSVIIIANESDRDLAREWVNVLTMVAYRVGVFIYGDKAP